MRQFSNLPPAVSLRLPLGCHPLPQNLVDADQMTRPLDFSQSRTSFIDPQRNLSLDRSIILPDRGTCPELGRHYRRVRIVIRIPVPCFVRLADVFRNINFRSARFRSWFHSEVELDLTPIFSRRLAKNPSNPGFYTQIQGPQPPSSPDIRIQSRPFTRQNPV